MFWEDYGPYVLVGFGIGIILVILLVVEALIVRANRRFLRESAAEMAELLRMAGRENEAEGVVQQMNEVLDRSIQDAAQRWKKRKSLRERR
jgi:heme exporter protein D